MPRKIADEMLERRKDCKELVHRMIHKAVWKGPDLGPRQGRQVARCVDEFAAAAYASLHLQLHGLVKPGEACLVTALSSHTDQSRPDAGRYHLGHQVFMSSLLRQHPGFDWPVIVFSHENATGDLRAQARAAYSRTAFVTPLTPSFTIARKFYRFKNGKLATSQTPLWKQGFYYARLQLFLLSMCSSVVAVDTGDSIVRRHFLDSLLAAVRSGGGTAPERPAQQASLPIGQSLTQSDVPRALPAGSRSLLSPTQSFAACQSSDAFAAPPLCGVKLDRPQAYFNAGMFAVGGACLNRATFAKLITTALMPPKPVGWDRKKRENWVDDQDVLNSVFSDAKWRRLPEDLTADKRILRHPRCATMSPAVLHFVGSKPWAPIYERLQPIDRDPRIVAVELAWWYEYLRDKTIVVGAGPSLTRPIGAWIELFGNVVRVNDFTMDAFLTGERTTHAFVHKATRATSVTSALHWLSPSAVHVAAFGENASVVQARLRRPGGIGLELVTQCTLLEPWYHRGLNQRIGMADPKGRHALLGTVALEWSLRNLVGGVDAPGGAGVAGAAGGAKKGAGPLFIVGFDMTMHPDRQYRHYSGHATSRTSRASLKKFHDVEADSRYVRSLVAKGLVRELVPDVLGRGRPNLRWSEGRMVGHGVRAAHNFVTNLSKSMYEARHILPFGTVH